MVMNSVFLKFLTSLSICMILYLFMKQDGIIDYYKEYRYYETLVHEYNELSIQLENLQKENQMLKHDKSYIEKIAREEYFYIYPDEIIINLD